MKLSQFYLYRKNKDCINHMLELTDSVADPGSGAFLTPGPGSEIGFFRISDPGSQTLIFEINIPDPQHCLLRE
jgi:hypothetical protein